MKRWPLASARCSLIRHLLYSEPLMAALYREMGRFDDAIALYEKSQNVSGRVPFGLAITYGKMNRREEAKEILKAACASRGSYTPGDAIAHVHVVLQEYEDAMRELARLRRASSSSTQLHRRFALCVRISDSSRVCSSRSDKRFVSIVKEIGLEPQKVFAITAD